MAPMASVLVVDDDQTVRQILEKLLRRSALAAHGVKIELAEDGEEALQILAKQKVDVVVLDLLMPGKSGLDVARAVRQLELNQPGAPTKIMFMSGVYPERTLNKELVALKAIFFTKPKGIVDIPAAIEKQLGFAPAPVPAPHKVPVPVSAATPPSGLAALARTPVARTATPAAGVRALSSPFQGDPAPAPRQLGTPVAPRAPSLVPGPIMPRPTTAPTPSSTLQPRPLGTPVPARAATTPAPTPRAPTTPAPTPRAATTPAPTPRAPLPAAPAGLRPAPIALPEKSEPFAPAAPPAAAPARQRSLAELVAERKRAGAPADAPAEVKPTSTLAPVSIELTPVEAVPVLPSPSPRATSASPRRPPDSRALASASSC